MRCLEEVRKNKKSCKKMDCRNWIDYECELNCILETVSKNNGDGLTLRECAKRLKISFVRVKQLEDQALKKLKAKKLSHLND